MKAMIFATNTLFVLLSPVLLPLLVLASIVKVKGNGFADQSAWKYFFTEWL